MNKQQLFEKDKNWYIENWDWFINGNYGETPYRNYQEQYKQALEMTPKRKEQNLRMIAINGFTNFVAEELNCSYGTAQKAIVNTIEEKELEKLTNQFISELSDILSE